MTTLTIEKVKHISKIANKIPAKDKVEVYIFSVNQVQDHIKKEMKATKKTLRLRGGQVPKNSFTNI